VVALDQLADRRLDPPVGLDQPASRRSTGPLAERAAARNHTPWSASNPARAVLQKDWSPTTQPWASARKSSAGARSWRAGQGEVAVSDHSRPADPVGSDSIEGRLGSLLTTEGGRPASRRQQ
jgi:hypothetical protein